MQVQLVYDGFDNAPALNQLHFRLGIARLAEPLERFERFATPLRIRCFDEEGHAGLVARRKEVNDAANGCRGR